MLRAVAKTAKWTTEKIHAIRDLLDDTCGYVANMNSRVYSRELVELIFIQPYCRIPHLMEAGIAKRPTASKYLNALSAIGVLNEYKLGRNKFFIHPKFINLLMNEENEFENYGEQKAP